MSESETPGAPWSVRFRMVIAAIGGGIGRFFAGLLSVLLMPLFVTIDAVRVVAWSVSGSFRQRFLGEKRATRGPCFDPMVESVTVRGVELPLCPFAIKYRGSFVLRLLCANAQVIASKDGGKLCICARDNFKPALPRWAIGAVLLLCTWVVVISVLGWGTWRGRYKLGLVERPRSQHLPVVDSKKATNLPDSEKKKAQDNVRSAKEYSASKRYSAARIEYRKAIQQNPALIEAYTGLAECCLQLGFVAEAKEALAKVTVLDPTSSSAYKGLTELAGQQRDFKQAMSNALKLCALQPKDKDARLLLARCYVATGDTTNAMLEVSQAIALAPDDAGPHVAAAYIELQQHPALAEEHCLTAIKLSATNVAARICLAGIYFNSDRKESAMKSLESAIAIEPFNIDAIMTMGRLHCATGAVGEAVALYRKKTTANPKLLMVRAEMASLLMRSGRVSDGYDAAMALNVADPDNVSSALILADMFLNQGLFTLAEEHARKALRINPDIVDAHKLLVRILLKRGNIDAALAYLKRLAKALPQDMDTQLQLAGCLDAKDQTEEAVKTLKALSVRYPESPLPHFHLSMLYAGHKEFDKAIVSCRQAAAGKPENALAVNNLASLLLDHKYQEKGVVDEAFELAVRARALAPESPVSADTLGWANYRKGNYDEAIVLLTSAQQRVPGSPEVRYHLAAALRAKGQLDEAKKQLEAALAISSTFTGVEDATAMLKDIKKQRGDK